MYTGNLSYIKSYYPTLLSVLDTYYVRHTDNATSLLLRQEGYGDYAFLPRNGPVTYYNALYVHALCYAADLATEVGRGGGDIAAKWRGRAQEIGAALLKRNWDAGVGAFFAALQKPCVHVSPLVQQSALLLHVPWPVGRQHFPLFPHVPSLQHIELAYFEH